MKAINILNDAMFAIGASSDINPASPEMINVSFRRLLQWVTQMTEQGLLLAENAEGVPSLLDLTALPSDPAGELGNAPATDLSLTAGLAPWIAPIFQIKLDLEAVKAAKTAMIYIATVSNAPVLPEWPETLPTGSGGRRGPWGRTYFPRPVSPFKSSPQSVESD